MLHEFPLPPLPDLSRSVSAHHAQLFDSDESLADTVAAFLAEGFVANDTMLAVMDEQRWYAVAMRLCARGVPVDDSLQSGQLTVRNASECLRDVMRRGRPDPAMFAASTASLVSELAGRQGHLRIYGEMVDLLAARGEYVAAGELEEFWDDLSAREDATLLCGYSASHFGDPRNANALRRICASHAGVLTNPNDVLGSFLVRTSNEPAAS